MAWGLAFTHHFVNFPLYRLPVRGYLSKADAKQNRFLSITFSHYYIIVITFSLDNIFLKNLFTTEFGIKSHPQSFLSLTANTNKETFVVDNTFC